MNTMKQMVVGVVLAVGLGSLSGLASAAGFDNPVLNTPARRNVEDMRDISRFYARGQIEQAVTATTGGQLTVTSRDRESGPLVSRAHDRGAIDVVTPQTGTRGQYEQARQISQRLGPAYTTVVEEVHRPARGAEGPSADIHRAYSNGSQGNTRVVAPRATANHTHLQPNYGIDIPRRTSPAAGSQSRTNLRPAPISRGSGVH